jgi:CheY-like chemotaxis protein
MMPVAGAAILMIEDNQNDVELTLHQFRRYHLTNSVRVIGDGAEALAYLFCQGPYRERDVKDQPHLILLDLGLPTIGGLEVLRRIRSDDRTRTIPIVVLTSSREEQNRLESQRLGIKAYIVKPIDFDKFTESTRLLGMFWIMTTEAPAPAA